MEEVSTHSRNGSTSGLPDVLTDVGRGSVSVGKLVKLPGSHGVHLEERDAARAPLLLRLVDGEEGFEEQVHDAPGDGRRVDSQAGRQVIHVAHIPKLERRTQMIVHFHHLRMSGTRIPAAEDVSVFLTCILTYFNHSAMLTYM